MARTEKTVFISYRRTDEPWALAVFENLTQHGYDVFVDYDGIASGNFEAVILENIRARAHFLVLLTPTALEPRSDPVDWMRREIEAALDSQRNIVPVMLEGFKFGTPAIASQLIGKLAALKEYNGLEVPGGYFSQAMERLRNKFLNVPVDAVLHSASDSAQQVAKEQQDKATMALGEALRQPSSAAARLIAPGRWRMVAGSAVALLLVAGIGLYQMGVPVWVPWTPRVEQPDAPGADKAKAAAKRKVEEAEQQRLAAAKAEEDRKAKVAADAEEMAIAAVLSGCYRRALFTRTHAQTNTDAMFASVAKCRETLQQQIPKIKRKDLQGTAVELLATIERIERHNPIPNDYDAINRAYGAINQLKLSALYAFRQLAAATGSSYPLPDSGKLAEAVYFTQKEADAPPALGELPRP